MNRLENAEQFAQKKYKKRGHQFVTYVLIVNNVVNSVNYRKTHATINCK